MHGVVPAAEQRRAVPAPVVGESRRRLPFGRDVRDEGPQPAEERIARGALPEQESPWAHSSVTSPE
jgi:hypothetical protein